MARKIQIRPPKIENIHGVRLVMAGAMNLLMLGSGGFAAQLAAHAGLGLLAHCFLGLAAAVGAATLAVVTPVFWRGNTRDRALGALAALFPLTTLIIFFISR